MSVHPCHPFQPSPQINNCAERYCASYIIFIYVWFGETYVTYVELGMTFYIYTYIHSYAVSIGIEGIET